MAGVTQEHALGDPLYAGQVETGLAAAGNKPIVKCRKGSGIDRSPLVTVHPTALT
jgi:hypothetical protein